jgi:hypothetical protein
MIASSPSRIALSLFRQVAGLRAAFNDYLLRFARYGSGGTARAGIQIPA